MDEEQVRRLLRMYRAATTAGNAVDGYRKTKRMLDDHYKQNNEFLNKGELLDRIINKKVRQEDVRDGAHAIINSIPRVYRVVSRHIKDRKNEKA